METLETFLQEADRRGTHCNNPEEIFASRQRQHRGLRSRPLVPTSGLYLEPRSEAGERLIPAFRETWKSLPAGVRRALCRYWREKQTTEAFILGAPFPSISVEMDWSGRSDAVGQWFPFRQAIRFWTPAVLLLPEPLLRTLIAHELCHAYFEAVGTHDSRELLNAREDMGIFGDVKEYEVRDCNEGWWGFDEEGLTDWLEENEPRLKEAFRAGTRTG